MINIEHSTQYSEKAGKWSDVTQFQAKQIAKKYVNAETKNKNLFLHLKLL